MGLGFGLACPRWYPLYQPSHRTQAPPTTLTDLSLLGNALAQSLV